MYLLFAAIAPALIIILYIYYQDRYEKEPKHLIIYHFGNGAILSILITSILYFAFDISMFSHL
ncbi:hypothetical protein [Aestuariivivens sediminicola]|uniref:hypothetical protein n=1 Tax=Aestuariivivens sediminicola TaxID=2913560 RepID=UPI001F5A2606|nr:hypothetical protein [Aestuariivivens sediminicola]